MWVYNLFPKILNMSLTASIVIVIVLLARRLLRRAPKLFSYVLWAVVLFRLICPVSPSTSFSLFRVIDAPVTTAGSMEYIPVDIVHMENPAVDLPVPGVSEFINNNLPQGEEQLVADPLEALLAIGTFIWISGIVIMILYSIFTLIRLHRKLVGVGRLRDNIFLADHIASPFVMGLIHPKIYLPSGISEEEQTYIIEHEKTHIRRGDHIVKCVAYFALMIHWFNPLVWLAFILAGKDMEMSCDEAVMKKLGGDIRADYSTSLLSLATGERIIAGTPLAFGEGNTKGRIKNVMHYKKPTFWVVIAAFICVISLVVVLASNPRQSYLDILGANYQVEEILYDAPQYSFTYTEETAPLYSITADYSLYEKAITADYSLSKKADTEWISKGGMIPVEYSRQELYALFTHLTDKAKKQLDKVDTIYRVDTGDKNQSFYLVMQTDSGDVLIAMGYDTTDLSLVRWLYRVKQVSDSYDLNYLELSIKSYLGGKVDVESFSLYETDTSPAFLIIGFLSDGSSDKSDLGFATFRFMEGRFLLTQCYVYSDAAIKGNKIYYAEHPAIANTNGAKSDETTYDVILSCNKDLVSITRIIDGTEEITETVSVNPSMTLFRWVDEADTDHKDKEHTVEHHFYDEYGGEIIYDVPKGSGISVFDGETELIPQWYETGFDYNYDAIPTIYVSTGQENLLIEVNSMDIGELTVSEDYYKRSSYGVSIKKESYTLKRDADNYFVLALPNVQSTENESIYFVRYRNGVYVFRVAFK